MRPFSFVLVCGLIAAAVPAAAQTRSQPTLALTIFGGAVTGHSLWHVDRQPFEVVAVTQPNPVQFGGTGQFDTLALTRTIGSSLLIGASATFYQSPGLGFQFEMEYLSLPLENGCRGLFYNADPDNKNQQMCDNVGGAQLSASGIGIYLGVTLRAAARGSISPYFRAGAGLTSISRSSVAMASVFTYQGVPFQRDFTFDDKPVKTSGSLLLGTGLTMPLGPGYQVRLELRDLLAKLTRLDGPADVNGFGPTSAKLYHHLALSIGLDVVLEQKRGRRY